MYNHVWARDAAFNKHVCSEREGTEMIFIFYNCNVIVPTPDSTKGYSIVSGSNVTLIVAKSLVVVK